MRRKKVLPASPKMQLPPRIKPPLAGARLAPFSGDRTCCTKCGHRGAHTFYKSPGETCVHNGQGTRIVWGLERLHRVCGQCRFTWDEACVPAIPVITQQTMVMPVVKE